MILGIEQDKEDRKQTEEIEGKKESPTQGDEDEDETEKIEREKKEADRARSTARP